MGGTKAAGFEYLARPPLATVPWSDRRFTAGASFSASNPCQLGRGRVSGKRPQKDGSQQGLSDPTMSGRESMNRIKIYSFSPDRAVVKKWGRLVNGHLVLRGGAG